MVADDEHPVTKCDKLDYLLDSIQNVSLASTISNISMMTGPCYGCHSRRLQIF